MSGEDMFKQISSRNGAGAPTYSASLSSSYASEVGHFGKGNSSKALNEKKIANAAERLLVVVILAICCIEGFISRLFAVIRFESIIHEFDPWFNYRATSQLVENGWYQFLNWFDDRAWYPLGRIVGGTVYPGLMITSGLIHLILNGLNFTVHIRDVCVFLAPLFSGLTAIAAYFLTKEIWSKGAGLLAACFMCIVPGYISRSVAGSYDNEGIAIFALLITYYFWIKSLKTGSVMWACITALSYMYMVSAWGGYVFITNLVPLHAFVLVLMQRYSHRLYVAFSVWFIMGLLLSMQVPFVGFQPVRTSEHMAAAGTFLLLQAYAFLAYLKTKVINQPTPCNSISTPYTTPSPFSVHPQHHCKIHVRSRDVSNEFFISQVRESIARHTSKLDCTKDTFKHEGMSGFYKGLLPSVVRVVPATVITFVVYEEFRHAFK
ncbi:dolichyl-diphosphooligosaccharide--protein glycosyltransferase subunit STT3B-like [Convolutriloba macropyga]|uniref:dolichyl-diphosphooligosaccharide--protein glycosyltransferase subunit STT3B-like n=1 Tax=Convolutriloba macropyga TaxID=536237 RepID=UPI003F51E06D